MLQTIYLLFSLVAVGYTSPKPVVKDPLIDSFQKQENLLKMIQKMMVEKFAETDSKIIAMAEQIYKHPESRYKNVQEKLNANGNALETIINATTCSQKGYLRNGYSCYLFVQEKMSWSAAKSHCHQHGGHLAIIDSAEEMVALNTFLERMLGNGENANYSYWIGGRRVGGVWRWDETNNPIGYTNWYPGEGGLYECMFYHYHPSAPDHIQWFANLVCSTKCNAICEL